ncbi:hypothetical protein HY636_04335 [Candidatus Woesearchaeota archaeon]|nr:hypothetical protein [Candidatus Woesearchaeota archaeon]
MRKVILVLFILIFLLVLTVISSADSEDDAMTTSCSWKVSGLDGYYSTEKGFFSGFEKKVTATVTEITDSTKCKLKYGEEEKIESNYYYSDSNIFSAPSATPDILVEDKVSYFKPINKVILKKDQNKITLSFTHNIDTQTVPKLKIYGLCYDSDKESKDGVVLYCGAKDGSFNWWSPQVTTTCNGVYAGTLSDEGDTAKIKNDFGASCTSSELNEGEID